MRQIPQDLFDGEVASLLAGETPEDILTIPGIYEILAEWYNNDILSDWEMLNPGDEELSSRFDDILHETFQDNVPDDGPMLRERFNNWTDALCKDGEISDYTYNNCTYVGQYRDKYEG